MTDCWWPTCNDCVCVCVDTSTRRSAAVWTSRSSSRVSARWATTSPWWRRENQTQSSRPSWTPSTPTGLKLLRLSLSLSVYVRNPVKIHEVVESWLLCVVVCRDGNVSLQEYMAFMISRETENVKSSEEIESAFRALSTENKPYVTKEELYQVRGGRYYTLFPVRIRIRLY